MLHPALAARPSPIHGTGLFAREALPAGTILWRFSPATSRRFRPGEDPLWTAFQDPSGGLWICTDDARFWNHSCEPNAAPRNDLDVALRPLAAGEEVTYDYGLFWPAAAPPFVCACGRERCRGTILRALPDSEVVRLLSELARRAGETRQG